MSLISRVARTTELRAMDPVPGHADVMFLEIDVVDPSTFSDVLRVEGADIDGYRILRAQSPAGRTRSPRSC